MADAHEAEQEEKKDDQSESHRISKYPTARDIETRDLIVKKYLLMI